MNEKLQRAILEALLEQYPVAMYEEELRVKLHPSFPDEVNEEGHQLDTPDIFAQEAFFLCELGAIERSDGELGYLVGWMKLSAKGKQYLQGTNDIVDYFTGVTIKFDEQNIRRVLDYIASQMPLHEGEKHTIREQIKKMPGKALEKLWDKILDKAVDPSVLVELFRNIPNLF